jgi:hypothetical protein
MTNQKQETKPAAKVDETGKIQPIKVEQLAKPAKVESNLLSQRDAVFQAIQRILRDDKVSFDGTSSVKPLLTEERLKRIYEDVAQGIRAKKVALKETPTNQQKLAEPALLQTYIVGLVNNWLRRDPRLNGSPKK